MNGLRVYYFYLMLFIYVLIKYIKNGQCPLKSDPWQRYTPSPYLFLDWYNRKGRKCRRHEHTDPGDHWERRSRSQACKALFLYWEYNAARSLISREISRECLKPKKTDAAHTVYTVRTVYSNFLWQSSVVGEVLHWYGPKMLIHLTSK